jgi:hypothetical protein
MAIDRRGGRGLPSEWMKPIDSIRPGRPARRRGGGGSVGGAQRRGRMSTGVAPRWSASRAIRARTAEPSGNELPLAGARVGTTRLERVPRGLPRRRRMGAFGGASCGTRGRAPRCISRPLPVQGDTAGGWRRRSAGGWRARPGRDCLGERASVRPPRNRAPSPIWGVSAEARGGPAARRFRRTAGRDRAPDACCRFAPDRRRALRGSHNL